MVEKGMFSSIETEGQNYQKQPLNTDLNLRIFLQQPAGELNGSNSFELEQLECSFRYYCRRSKTLIEIS